MKKLLIGILLIGMVVLAVSLVIFLSDARILMIKTNYSILITWFTSLSYPAVVVLIMKAIAMLNPNVPSDKIRDLLTWKGGQP
jgi:hypothetical protein